MYHLTEEGPRPCHARKGRCPYKTTHFETFDQAEEAYSARFDFRSHKKQYAPAKSGFITPTSEEARAVLKEFQVKYPYKAVLSGSLVGHSNFGSIVYNLDNPKSDNDLFFLSDIKASGDFQNVDSQKRDVRVSSVYSFAQEYLNGTHFNVDIAHSGALQISIKQEWYPYINGLRFKEYSYLTKLRGLSEKFAKTADSKKDHPSRAIKLMKTTLRNEILSNRFQREENVRPVFTADERENFYHAMNVLDKKYVESKSIHKLIQQPMTRGKLNEQ